MVYVDTSVLVAYYCPENLSPKAEDFLRAHVKPGISLLTEVELFSAVSRKVREGELDRKDGRKILAKFLEHLDKGFFTSHLVGAQHYRLARDWMGRFNTTMKSLDALHLATASIEECTLVTADRRLAESGEILGVKVEFLK